jgi:diguanylate cyclase (GGDEF)-like protein/PAS domain S-box-containing protein
MATKAEFSRLDAKRREQVPQALARLVVVVLFIGLWFVLLAARIPMPVPFLIVLVAETIFFLAYLRVVFWLPNVPSISLAQYTMLTAEIVFHTTIVYFLGSVSWLGAFAYVFGLIFTNTFLDLRRGFIYTTGASLAFVALLLLEATGVVPHYVYLDQGPFRYEDPRLVATTIVGSFGVFFSIYLWVNWVGRQLRVERDTAVRAQESLLEARSSLQTTNEELEGRVRLRTAELEESNAALRESEERLRSVIGSAPVVLLAFNADGVFTLMEGRGLDSIAVSRDEIIGRSIFDVFRGQTEVLDSVRRALAGEETEVVTRPGPVSFETRLIPVRNGNGAVTSVIGVATDVTARRRSERLITEERTVFELIATDAPLGETLEAIVLMIERQASGVVCSFCLVDDSGMLRTAAAPRLPEEFRLALDGGIEIGPRGGSCGAAASRRQPVFVEDVERDPAWEELAEVALRNGIRASWSTPIIDAHGNVVGTFAMHARDARLPAGRESQLIEIATHIAGIAISRKKAEERLRESEERFRRLADNAIDVIFRYRLEPTGHFEYMSPVSAALIGYSPEEFYANPTLAFETVLPEDRTLLQRMFVEDDQEPTTLRWRHKDGHTVWFETRIVSLRDADNRIVAVEGIARDASARHQAEEALREGEERFRRLAENAPDIIFRFLTGDNRRYEYVSPASTAVIGYSPEEFYADPDLGGRILHPEDQEALIAGLQSDRSEPAVFRWIAKDGTTVFLESRFVPIRSGDGTLVAIEGIVRDVTDRRAWEDALRESEERFRRLAENAADIIFRYRLAPTRGFEYISPATTDIIGYAPEEFYADPDLSAALVHSEDREQLQRISLGGTEETLMRWTHRDGSTVWIESRSVPILGEDGSIVAVEGIARDVTERRKWEEALRESENKFRTMAETVAAAVFIFQGTKMRYVNSAAEEITGYARNELLTLDFWDVIDSEYQELTRERGLARQRGEQVPRAYEVKIRTKDGQEKWVDFTAGTVDFEGAPAVLGTAFDITQRKRAEGALQDVASRDPLTGVLNRRAGLATIEQQLKVAKASHGRLAVLALDLDRFKRINDSYNHEMGDNALLEFTRVLNSSVADGTICRLGGDEFEIALPRVDLPEAIEFAEALQRELRDALDQAASAGMPPFTVSIGIACYGDDGDTVEALGRRADEAMYAAKAAGGNRAQAWRRLPPSRAA